MSPETIARSVLRLKAAGVAWPTTRRVAITVGLAGLADVIALGEGVVAGPTAARDAVGHVLRAVGTEADPAAALSEIAKIQRVLSVMESTERERPGAEHEAGHDGPLEPRASTGPADRPNRDRSARDRPTRDRSTRDRSTPDRATSDRPTTGRPATGSRPLPVRPVHRAVEGPA